MVLDPQKQAEAEAIFKRWDLDFAIVGLTTDDLRFRVLHNNQQVADLPIKELGDEAPEYDRPYQVTQTYQHIDCEHFPEPEDYNQTILDMLSSPNLCSRRWVWEQYDTLVQSNSLQIPGGDAGVVRIVADGEGGTNKALAFTCDVNPHYCEADPFEGGKQAVAESWRNLCSVGARPLAVTDNLNFGNPEKPEIMGQLVRAIEGIGEACVALDMPVVSGNVSLYNETQGAAILPTPTIGAVGIIDDYSKMACIGGADEGDILFLVGNIPEHLAQSTFAREILDIQDGPPPPVDLFSERRNGEFVRAAITSGYATSCHDISDGGLAICLAEMCLASNIGARIELEHPYLHATLFGEDQGHYLFTVDDEWADMYAANSEGSGVPFFKLGTMGGDQLEINDNVRVSLDEMRNCYETWFDEYMSPARFDLSKAQSTNNKE